MARFAEELLEEAHRLWSREMGYSFLADWKSPWATEPEVLDERTCSRCRVSARRPFSFYCAQCAMEAVPGGPLWQGVGGI